MACVFCRISRRSPPESFGENDRKRSRGGGLVVLMLKTMDFLEAAIYDDNWCVPDSQFSSP